jgi:hypothetical protein
MRVAFLGQMGVAGHPQFYFFFGFFFSYKIGIFWDAFFLKIYVRRMWVYFHKKKQT